MVKTDPMERIADALESISDQGLKVFCTVRVDQESNHMGFYDPLLIKIQNPSNNA
tara:strand:+ start:63 stop:227 length:165 start_codon:yes stop_codon:yes gene_type:complete